MPGHPVREPSRVEHEPFLDMPDVPPSRRRAAFVIGVAALLLIECATLPPQRAVGGLRHLWRFALDPGHLRETAANVLLFVPFGVALGTAGHPAVRSALVAASLSVVVELLQVFAATGRFAESQDVVANTLGATLGWLCAWMWFRLLDELGVGQRRCLE